jgi:hypothetical protein
MTSRLGRLHYSAITDISLMTERWSRGRGTGNMVRSPAGPACCWQLAGQELGMRPAAASAFSARNPYISAVKPVYGDLLSRTCVRHDCTLQTERSRMIGTPHVDAGDALWTHATLTP